MLISSPHASPSRPKFVVWAGFTFSVAFMFVESALRTANEKFTKRFTALEDRLHARGRSVHDATLEEMEREWALVKEHTSS